MIDYNPEKHYDKLLNYIVEAYLAGEELDMPLLPHKNNGEPNICLFTGEEWYIFPNKEQYRQLFADAYSKHIEFLHRTDQEPKNTVYSNGNSQYEPELNSMSKAFFDWIHQPTEEGIVLTKGDKQLLMTSEPYWSKEEQNKKSEMEQWVEEKTQKLVEAGMDEQEARKWACIGWVSHCIDTPEYENFDYGDFRDLMTNKSNKQKQSHP